MNVMLDKILCRWVHVTRCLLPAVALLGLPWAAYGQAAQPGDGTGAEAPGGNGAAAPVVLGPGVAGSQGRVSSGVLTGRPSVVVARAASQPQIDGRLDDAIWRNAMRVTDFVQQRPVEGAPATEQTEVHIAYDSQNIYFAIYAHYSDRKLIRANRVDRDQTAGDDNVRLYFDPFLDQQRAYVFAVNGYGVQSDSVLNSADATTGTAAQLTPGVIRGVTVVDNYAGQTRTAKRDGLLDRIRRKIVPQNHTSGGRRSGVPGDSFWDALFESAGTLVDDGWTAEIAIPFKSLRYPGRQDDAHRWGFQIERTIESKNESVVWAPVSRNVMGILRQMGVLEGMTGVSTSRNLELLPTFTAVDADMLLEDGHEDHQHESPGANAEGAINVKYGLTSDLVFDFTYNPDFSQIESDRAQIEVNQRFPVFYPELRPFFLEGVDIYQVGAPFQVYPVHTRTLVDPRFGAKLSGKIRNMSVGFRVADDEAPGKLENRNAPGYGETANVVLGRVRYDLYSESYVGAIVTDRELLDGYSRVGGVDGMFRVGANHRARFTAMNADRRDGVGRRSTGSLLDFNLRKEGRHLVYDLAHNEIHPDFGTDLGFIRRVDQKQSTAMVGYRSWPENWIVNWEPRFQYERNYDFNGVLQDEGFQGRLGFQFAKNINVYTNVNRDMERYRDIDFWKSRYSFGWTVNTSRRISIAGSTWTGDQIRFVEQPFLGADRQLNLLIGVRPLSRLQSEINLNTSRFVDIRTDSEAFDIKIARARTTYQFSNRFLVRNIIEYNTFEKTIGGNVLFTYRVNAGTVFFVGYDDHFRQGSKIDDVLYPTSSFLRTNRALFTKLSYLFRY